MRALSKISLAVLMLSVVALAGCKETYKLTFTNVSGQSRALEIDSPAGIDDIAPLADGRRSEKTLKIEKSDIPADCTVTAGSLKKRFMLDKSKELFFYIEEKTIVGPLNKNDTYRSTGNFEGKMKTGQKEVVTGEKPMPKPNEEVPVDTHEVVE